MPSSPLPIDLSGQVVLVTGAAQRIGAGIARTLHGAGMNLVLHYHQSDAAAHALRDELHARRAHSVTLAKANLLDMGRTLLLIEDAVRTWGRLDALINNASTFYPTPLGEVTLAQWEDLLTTNLKAPFFLSQAAAPYLAQHHGVIINITDIHADRPMKNHAVYSIAKAGLSMLTKSLARELGPHVRVNAVAPGAIMWPDHPMSDAVQHAIIDSTALKRQGDPIDIANAVLYLIGAAGYVTGQILAVDGGRSLRT